MGSKEQFGGRLLVGIKAGTRRLLKRFFWKTVRQQERRDIENVNVKQRKGWYD